MTSNAAQVLGVMLRDLGHVNGAVTALNTNLAQTKVVAAAAMTALTGAAVLTGLAAIVGRAKELNSELERMRMLGGDFAAGVDRTRAAAFGATITAPTTTAGGNVAMQRELAGLVGDPRLAAELLPFMSRAAYVASFYTKEDPSKIAQNLLKAADIRGALLGDGPDGGKIIDWEKLRPEIEWAIKGLIIQGGMIKSADILGMVRQGSVPMRGMGARDAYIDMVEIASAFGGQRAGTALTSLYQQFIGGRMTRQSAVAMTEAGLLRPEDWTSGRSGGVVVTPEGTRRFSEMEAGPAQWFMTKGLEQVRAYAAANGMTEAAALFRIAGRQTTQRLLSEIAASDPQIRRSREIAGDMGGVDDLYRGLLDRNLATNIQSFTSAWQTLMEALGEAMIPAAIGILQKLTEAVQGLTQWALANPETVQTLAGLATGVAVFALALGAFAIGGAAAGALGILNGPAGIAALAGGLTALAGALSGFPPWLVAMIGGAAAGAAVGSRFGGYGAAGGAMLGGAAGLAANVPTGPDLSRWDQRPSRLTNEPVGAGLRRFFGFGVAESVVPPPPVSPSQREPVPVIVANPGDLEFGMAGAVARRLAAPGAMGGVDVRIPSPFGAVPQ